MLSFVGLGLYDERSITVEGREAVRAADRAFAEFYTSRLAGATVADLESYHGVEVEVRDRAGVERDPDPILDAAEAGTAAFLTAGDPMVSTTHVDLRLRAHDRGIDTRLVHGTSAATAAAGLTGLQNYRFGKATTLPFPDAHGGVPDSVLSTLRGNAERGLHTLAYLDIRADGAGGDGEGDGGAEGDGERENDGGGEFMTAPEAADLLADAHGDVLGVAVARAGSPDPAVAADRLSALADRDLGDPLHLLVIPGDLHHLEAEALRKLGGAPDDLLEEV